MSDYAYNKGKKAFQNGEKRESCPHKKPISKQRHYWMLGWDTANEQDARAAIERKMGIRD